MSQPPLHIHVIDSLGVGGAQVHLISVFRESLRAWPFRHRVISLFGDGPMRAEYEALGVPVDILDVGPAIRSRRFDRAVTSIRSCIRPYKPQVVECHLSFSRIFGLPAAWLAKVPVRIGFEHGDLYLTGLKYRVAHSLAQNFAHSIVLCSHALAEWAAREQGLRKRKMRVLYPAVDTEMFHPEVRPVPGRFGFAASTTLFCAVGSLGTGVNKRVDILIRALHTARASGADVGLIIRGDGELRPGLERLVAELNLGQHVRFAEYLRDLPAMLATCDAFCHATPFEPFGLVCVEAMAMGLPVIVPDTGGPAEIVDHERTGLSYPALDVGRLSAAMTQLAADSELRQRLGALARNEVLGRFTIESSVRRLYDLYAEFPRD